MDYTRAAEICERIAEVIGERGHTRNEYEDKYGKVCLLGAGRRAAGWQFDWETGRYTRDEKSTHAAGEAALECWSTIDDTDRDTAEALGFSRDGDVILWNDGMNEYPDEDGKIIPAVPGATQEEVLDRAIEWAKYWRNQPTVDTDDSEVVESVESEVEREDS